MLSKNIEHEINFKNFIFTEDYIIVYNPGEILQNKHAMHIINKVKMLVIDLRELISQDQYNQEDLIELLEKINQPYLKSFYLKFVSVEIDDYPIQLYLDKICQTLNKNERMKLNNLYL